jgi:hypothetical protein
MSDDMPHEEIGQLLEVVTEKLPQLLTQLRATLFSADAGREMGQAVGSFYKELIASGIPEEEALSMAKSYIGSIQGLLNQRKSGHGGGGS